MKKHIWKATKIFWFLIGILIFSLLISIYIKTFVNTPVADVSSVHGLIPKILVAMIGTTAIISVLMVFLFLVAIIFVIYLLTTFVVWIIKRILK